MLQCRNRNRNPIEISTSVLRGTVIFLGLFVYFARHTFDISPSVESIVSSFLDSASELEPSFAYDIFAASPID